MTRGDWRNKELALGRIKRLANSRLALEPFARVALDLLNDGVPHTPTRVMLAGGGDYVAQIGTAPGILAGAPPHRHFPMDAAEVLGVRIQDDGAALPRALPSKAVRTLQEIALTDLHGRAGFNPVNRPLGGDHLVQVVFQKGGEVIGYYPIWRSADLKPFSPEDVAFLEAAAPHIAHGLEAVRPMKNGHAAGDGFAPLPGGHSGVVLVDRDGRLIAMDAQASWIFHQLSVLDGLSANPLFFPQVREAIDHLMQSITSLLDAPDGEPSPAGAPLYRLYHHWSGIVLRLRGVRVRGSEGRAYTTVLIERGETGESRRGRLLIKWGLSDREAEVLSFIAEGKTGLEISVLLRISHDTVRKHTSRILEKLGVETRAAAASLARDSGLNHGGNR